MGITPLIQRQVEEEEEILHTKEVSDQTTEVAPDIESGINRLKGGGQPLPESVRAFFEHRIGYDFSKVQVHVNTHAHLIARAMNACAFTLGKDVIFGTGQYAPGTVYGNNLLAHELTHVVQQNQAGGKISSTTLYRAPEKKSSEKEKIYEALFVKTPSKGTCKEWSDKPTKEHPSTTGKEMVDEFRDNLKEHLKKHPMVVMGEVSEKITEVDVDKIAAKVNKKIIAKFGSHIASPLSDVDIAKRVEILPAKKTMLPEFVKQWLANWIYKLTSIADYCVDEGDKRFQKVIDDILADSTMAKDVRIMASRQSAFIEGDEAARTVYIHKGADESLAESILTHEIVHFYAHKDYLAWNAKMVAPRFVNEGFTEFLAREVMSGTRKSYEERFAFIRDEVAKYVTVDDIAAAFFAGKVWQVENVSKVAIKLFKEFTEREKSKEKGK